MNQNSYLMGLVDSLRVFTVGYMKDKLTTVILLASAASSMEMETFTLAISKKVGAPIEANFSQLKDN